MYQIRGHARCNQGHCTKFESLRSIERRPHELLRLLRWKVWWRTGRKGYGQRFLLQGMVFSGQIILCLGQAWCFKRNYAAYWVFIVRATVNERNRAPLWYKYPMDNTGVLLLSPAMKWSIKPLATIEVWATPFWHGVIHRRVVTPVQWGVPCWAMYWSLHSNPWDVFFWGKLSAKRRGGCIQDDHGWSMSINDVSWLTMIEEAYNHIQLFTIYPWPTLFYMHDLHSVKRTISAPSCCFLPAAWQILQALRGLDISTVSFYVAPNYWWGLKRNLRGLDISTVSFYVVPNYWWGLKRNPAGCTPKDLKCPISDPAVFLTWWWPNIMNLPLTYPFAMWHER